MAVLNFAGQFEAELKTVVADEREKALQRLSVGAPEDYPAYREEVGFLRALKSIDDWIDEARRNAERKAA